MVVKREQPVNLADLDLGYLAFFLGLRINELVSERLAAAGFADVRQSHGYVIQHLIGQEHTITELARRMGVTQQAASKSVAEMVRIGLLELVGGGDRRAKRVRLSERGRESVQFARRIRRRIELRLVRRLGASAYDAVKSTLLQCLSGFGDLDWLTERRVRAPR
jgi:DNA-binding MarR family transcriptional regulator